MSNELTLWIRVLDLCLGLVALIWLVLKCRYWREFDGYAKLYVVSLMVFCATLVYGSAEAIYENATGGYRSLFSTAAVLLTLFALWKTRGHTMTSQPKDPE